MLTKNKFNIAFIAALFFLPGIYAQELKKDVVAINAAYKKHTKMSLVMVIDMYESYTSNKLYYSQKIDIKRNGSSIFQSSEESESITTPDYYVLKDDDEKLIAYAPKKTVQKEGEGDFLVNIDSIRLFCKTHKFNKENSELCSYDFVMQDYYPNYNRIKLFFNSKTFFIEKMVFYCDEDDISTNNEDEKFARARIEINYTDINTNPKYNESDFTYQKYLTRQGSKFFLKPNYKNYELSVSSF